MVAEALVAVGPPVMVNAADVAPAGTVTDAGTFAAGLLLLSETTAPPEGAALPRVMVPCEVAPAMIVDGLTTKEDNGGRIVSVDVTLAAP